MPAKTAASSRSTAARKTATRRMGFLTVGQTARILGVSPSTLRMWESVALVAPVRSNGRYRLYSPELLKVLKRIKYLREVQRLNVPGIKRELGKRATPTSYGTTVMELFQAPRTRQRLVRPADRRVLEMQSGVRMEMLSTNAMMLQSMLFRVAPHAGSDGAYSHQGEEFIFMMAGTLEVWLDELECFVIHAGDSLWFESTLGHRWFNPSDTEAVLLWINTPPTF